MRSILLLSTALASTLFSTLSPAQCATVTAPSFTAIPSFFSLYLNDHCISRNLSDTTVCVQFSPSAIGRVATFSYSSPNGSPAFVTEYNQYNQSCEYMGTSPLIYPSADTTTVCYTVQTALIDNFCPYALNASGLSVEWCSFTATVIEQNINVKFSTCSNQGTHRFFIQTSKDLITWNYIGFINAKYPNSSTELFYDATFPASLTGDQYVRILEVDLGNRKQPSDPVFITVPETEKRPVYDLAGRLIGYR
jgi:hypothetical protein